MNNKTYQLSFKEKKDILNLWHETATDYSKEKNLTAQESVNLMIDYLQWYIEDKGNTKTGRALQHLIDNLKSERFDNVDKTDSSIDEVRVQVLEMITSTEWIIRRSMKVVGYVVNIW